MFCQQFFFFFPFLEAGSARMMSFLGFVMFWWNRRRGGDVVVGFDVGGGEKVRQVLRMFV